MNNLSNMQPASEPMILNQTPIEVLLQVDEEGKTTARKLYEFLGLNPTVYARWCNDKIIKNEYAEEGKDYEVLYNDVENPQGGRPSQDYKLSASFAKKLAMGTHNERGEQAKNYFIEVEKRHKNLSTELNQLSPQLQLLINMELKQKKIEQELLITKQETAAVKEEIQDIRDVMIINPGEDWRSQTNKLLSKICKQLNDYQKPKEYVYKTLEQRGHCQLSIRLNNLKVRALGSGMAPSKVNQLNNLDVIEEEPRLREIYVAIVKEMAIKNGIDLKQ